MCYLCFGFWVLVYDCCIGFGGGYGLLYIICNLVVPCTVESLFVFMIS